jgi:hypothetical protein
MLPTRLARIRPGDQPRELRLRAWADVSSWLQARGTRDEILVVAGGCSLLLGKAVEGAKALQWLQPAPLVALELERLASPFWPPAAQEKRLGLHFRVSDPCADQALRATLNGEVHEHERCGIGRAELESAVRAEAGGRGATQVFVAAASPAIAPSVASALGGTVRVVASRCGTELPDVEARINASGGVPRCLLERARHGTDAAWRIARPAAAMLCAAVDFFALAACDELVAFGARSSFSRMAAVRGGKGSTWRLSSHMSNLLGRRVVAAAMAGGPEDRVEL